MLTANSKSTDQSTLATGVAEFRAGYENWDANRFHKASELIKQATQNAPDFAANFYWLGVVEFHRMLYYQNASGGQTNRLAIKVSRDTAMTALNRAVKLDPRHAESHALLATLYGMQIENNLARAIWYGPKVQKHGKLSLDYAPESPRVQYLIGACKFHTAKKPDAFREALATLLKAEELFNGEAKNAPGPLEPRWGYAGCLVLIGQTFEQLDQKQKAAEYFLKAVAVQPSNVLAKHGLERVTKNK